MFDMIGNAIAYVVFYPIITGPQRIWAYVWDRIDDKWWRHFAVWLPPILIVSQPSLVAAPFELGMNLLVIWPAAKFGSGGMKTMITIINIFAAGFVVSTVFLGPVHLLIMKLRQPDTTHGSASWGDEKAARKTGRLARKGCESASGPGKHGTAGNRGGLMLGRVVNPKRVSGHDPRYRVWNHVLTFAPTGAGKGIGCVIPNLLEYPGSVFCLDVKGENYQVAGRRRRELGQAVHVLDPFHVVCGPRNGGGMTGTQTSRVNWLDWINPKSPEAVSDSASLMDTLVVRSDQHESCFGSWDCRRKPSKA